MSFVSENERALSGKDRGYYIQSDNSFHTWRFYNWNAMKERQGFERLRSILMQKNAYSFESKSTNSTTSRQVEKETTRQAPHLKSWDDVRHLDPTVTQHFFSEFDKKMYEAEKIAAENAPPEPEVPTIFKKDTNAKQEKKGKEAKAEKGTGAATDST